MDIQNSLTKLIFQIIGSIIVGLVAFFSLSYLLLKLPSNNFSPGLILLKKNTFLSKSIDLDHYFYTYQDLKSGVLKIINQPISDNKKIVNILELFSKHQKHGNRLSKDVDFINYNNPNYYLINEPTNFCSARSKIFARLLRDFGFTAKSIELNKHVINMIELNNQIYLIDTTNEDWGINYTFKTKTLGTLNNHLDYLKKSNLDQKIQFYDGIENNSFLKVKSVPIDKKLSKPIIKLPPFSIIYYLDKLDFDEQQYKIDKSIDGLRNVSAITYSLPFFNNTINFFHPIYKIDISSFQSQLEIVWNTGEKEKIFGTKNLGYLHAPSYIYELNVYNRWKMLSQSVDERKPITGFTITNQNVVPTKIKIYGLYNSLNFID